MNSFSKVLSTDVALCLDTLKVVPIGNWIVLPKNIVFLNKFNDFYHMGLSHTRGDVAYLPLIVNDKRLFCTINYPWPYE